MANSTSTLGKFFSGLARLYRGFRAIILNLLFVLIVLLVFTALVGQPPLIVPKGSALLIKPAGTIVDQLTFVDPLNLLMSDSLGNNQNSEILLKDLLDAIELASSDADISSIVLVLNNLNSTGFSKLQDVGDALETFKASGKKIYAYADNYTQGQYYLAAHADEIILNPMGSIGLEGFSSYQYYYKDALDKLGVNYHIFRVGEFKSAVEPYERNDMSADAREAANDWIGDLWQQYNNDLSEARSFENGFISEFINNMDVFLEQTNGNFSQLALDLNLIDQVMDRSEINAYLQNEIGRNISSSDFLSIDFENYLIARDSQLNLQQQQQNSNKIGIIVASGTIVDGPSNPGEVGGDSLQRLIQSARNNDDIKAVVLRVDSPGGSAFASEVIRSELAKLVNEGKPLIVSMGSVAASGGYWIATAADEIWASNSTITGSIGIFGLYPTFEQSFEKLGIYTDGLGTTELAGAYTVGRDFPQLAGNVMQLTLENGYQRFISLVADARNMSIEEVDSIARGRVWSGEDALTNGLVDNIGNLEQAVAAAARLAQIENYGIEVIEQTLTPGQQLIQDLANNVSINNFFSARNNAQPTNVITAFYKKLNTDLQALVKYNDPNGLYLQCQECLSPLSP